jgi:hypothetical protein
MLPAELETWPQVWFEQYGGFNKGRDFRRVIIDSECIEDPLYPLPPFGVGGNMAVRTSVLREIGAFDVYLGAGTPSMGAEDTKMFSSILRMGHRSMFDPSAVTFHLHRRSVRELTRQFFGYGVGLSAYYTSLLYDDPLNLGRLLRLAPLAMRDLGMTETSLRKDGIASAFPDFLLRANHKGLVVGPFRYLKARLVMQS